MKGLELAAFAVFAVMIFGSASAYMNVTYLNTTITLNRNNSAHVIEVLSLYISNSSISQYNTSRQAVNLTLGNWQKVLNTNLLVEHILSPVSSVYNFNFLPGPVQIVPNGGVAQIVMSYEVRNITSERVVAPRRFLYTFNNTFFNFMHTPYGEALPPNARLNIIIPPNSKLVSVYPLPDYPYINFVSNSTNSTMFSWYRGEPLAKFTFSYIATESLGTEVTDYFGRIYNAYSAQLYMAAIIIVVAIAAYMYIKVVRARG
ncbi:MAG: hypothetical protein QW774_00105 [Candidatus Micrarchaeaceae archaeon]